MTAASKANASRFLLGADENGLGSLVGPMITTAVLAETTSEGASRLLRRPRGHLARDLADSKELVRFGHMALAEAWCRALLPAAQTPSELLEHLGSEALARVRSGCPTTSAKRQCWGHRFSGSFEAPPDVVERLRKHVARWRTQGVEVRSVESEIICARELNVDKEQGRNRFISDLHAMERLLLRASQRARGEVDAICGKVGGMRQYPRFFGPLAGHLITTQSESAAASSYHVAGVGHVSFQRGADERYPLVMLASLVGKYVRELCMARIVEYYQADIPAQVSVSGYHDPKTRTFVQQSDLIRRRSGIPNICFIR